MYGNDRQVGDILEGKDCALSKDKSMLFKVFENNKETNYRTEYVSIIRLEDGNRGCWLIPFGAPNWRLVKRNGHTICNDCKAI